MYFSYSHRLDLNLRSSKNDDDNIVLNISVRFIEKCIVRNTRENGEWGIEEREEHLYDRKDDALNPIAPGMSPKWIRPFLFVYFQF